MSLSYIHCQSNTFAGLARSYQSAVPEGFLEEWARPARHPCLAQDLRHGHLGCELFLRHEVY